MSAAEMRVRHDAKTWGRDTVVPQSGEDYSLTAEWIAGIVLRISAETRSPRRGVSVGRPEGIRA